MKALITEYRFSRYLVWTALTVTAVMLDMRFGRRTADTAGSLICLVYFVLGNGYGTLLMIYELIYIGLTVTLGIPWAITVVSLAVLYEIREAVDRKRRRRDEDEWFW